MAGWTRLWQFVSCKKTICSEYQAECESLKTLQFRWWFYLQDWGKKTGIRGRRWRCLRMVLNSSSQKRDTSWSSGKSFQAYTNLNSQAKTECLYVVGDWTNHLSITFISLEKSKKHLFHQVFCSFLSSSSNTDAKAATLTSWGAAITSLVKQLISLRESDHCCVTPTQLSNTWEHSQDSVFSFLYVISVNKKNMWTVRI